MLRKWHWPPKGLASICCGSRAITAGCCLFSMIDFDYQSSQTILVAPLAAITRFPDTKSCVPAGTAANVTAPMSDPACRITTDPAPPMYSALNFNSVGVAWRHGAVANSGFFAMNSWLSFTG